MVDMIFLTFLLKNPMETGLRRLSNWYKKECFALILLWKTIEGTMKLILVEQPSGPNQNGVIQKNKFQWFHSCNTYYVAVTVFSKWIIKQYN